MAVKQAAEADLFIPIGSIPVFVGERLFLYGLPVDVQLRRAADRAGRPLPSGRRLHVDLNIGGKGVQRIPRP